MKLDLVPGRDPRARATRHGRPSDPDRVPIAAMLKSLFCASGPNGMARASKATALARLDRITFDPEVMGGRACIRGLRVTVATIVDQMAEGASIEGILADYPYLQREDVRQALSYAARLARDEVVPV